MKLVTSDQMRRIDRETIDNHGIPGPDLMENAGRGIAERILEDYLDAAARPKVAIFCGKGNNGGDGYVVGRYLDKAGISVAVYFIGPIDKLSPDARLNFDRAAGIGLSLTEITDIAALTETLEYDYILDAIFGTGFAGAPRGLTGEVIEYINNQPQPVFAVDLPSGLNADSGAHEGAVAQAAATFTLALPKYGLYVSPGRELAGDMHVIPIGVPDEVVSKFDLSTELIAPDTVADLLPDRLPDGHKGDFGKLYLVAGSTGMTGAAALAARSALRGGCGLAKVGCPRTALPMVAASVLEATTHPLPDVAKKGALALRALGEIRTVIKEQDALAIGPGLGQHHETKELVRRLVAKLSKPAVVDADGLNALAGHMDEVKAREGDAPLVLTPHPGEFKRLSGETVPHDVHERIALAQRFAADYNVVLVLKGSPTVIADPSGACFLNPTGNHGMATGGSGDVLTGLIGSFLAQGMAGIDAAVAGVFVHGLAGDYAAEELTPRAMIAGDIAAFIPEVFEALGE